MWSARALARRSFARSTRGEVLRVPGVLSVSLPDDSRNQQQQYRFLATEDEVKHKKAEASNKKKPEKRNFDKEILQPAAKGQLPHKHGPGIPKLASRGKHKAHLTPPPKRSGGRFSKILKNDSDFQDAWDDDLGWMGEAASDSAKAVRGKNSNSQPMVFSSDPRSSMSAADKFERALGDYSNDEYYAPELLDDDRYFWKEEEYEALLEDDDITDLELNDDGVFEIEINESEKDSIGIAGEDDHEEDDDEEANAFDSRRRSPASSDEMKFESSNPEAQFFFDQNDVFEIASLDEKLFNEKEEAVSDIVLPLAHHGSQLDDFLEAMINHPTKYAEIMSEQLHPDSKREPKPIIPGGRLNPPLQFVESHLRFLFVTGLPYCNVDGEPGNVDNPVHRAHFQKRLARLFNIDSDSVFPTDVSSGFIGFSSPRELADALKKGPSEPVMRSLPTISLCEEDVEYAFAKVSHQSTVLITGIPPGNTARTLVEKLFPVGTEVGTVYQVSPGNIHFVSPTHALIRFSSEEQAESAVVSHVLGEQLKAFGVYPIRIFRARRELVHAGFDGPNKMKEKRSMGSRLIVDGDMPTKKFFLSHAGVIQLRNVDINVKREDIAAAFQPFCIRPRDVETSVEFVTCEGGLSTGIAYVGFDTPWEAEDVIKALNGAVSIGGTKAKLRLVKDRRIPGLPFVRPEKRPDRSTEQLLDDLNNWERFASQEDLKILEDAGISKTALDEALRVIRYNNASFSVFDSSIRAESLQPEKMTGELYKELVQMYVSTLKECIATPENVGELYQSVHFPGEQIDLSIFDREKQRQKELLERRRDAV